MQNVINELNTVLKGEQMAIDSYSRFIEEIKDENIKDELRRIKDDHKKHAAALAGHIRALGGKADSGTGLAGIMAGAKQLVQGIGTTDIKVLQSAYDGEDKGIGMTEEVIKGDLDDQSRDLVMGILSEDHDHLKNMAMMIGKIENGE